MKNICDWNNCSEEGLFKAPKERDNSKDYRLLCLNHVKEFNKSWNYFTGMSDQQIIDFAAQVLPPSVVGLVDTTLDKLVNQGFGAGLLGAMFLMVTAGNANLTLQIGTDRLWEDALPEKTFPTSIRMQAFRFLRSRVEAFVVVFLIRIFRLEKQPFVLLIIIIILVLELIRLIYLKTVNYRILVYLQLCQVNNLIYYQKIQPQIEDT